MLVKKNMKPWLVWLSWLAYCPLDKGLQIQFPVRSCAWISCLIPGPGAGKRDPQSRHLPSRSPSRSGRTKEAINQHFSLVSCVCLSLPLSLKAMNKMSSGKNFKKEYRTSLFSSSSVENVIFCPQHFLANMSKNKLPVSMWIYW